MRKTTQIVFIAVIFALVGSTSLFANQTSVRFANIDASCEDGTLAIDIQVTNTSTEDFRSNDWNGRFTFNDQLLDYPELASLPFKGDFNIHQDGNTVSFSFDAKKSVLLPAGNEWVTLATIHFDILSYFPGKDGNGIDLQWKSGKLPAVSARNMNKRGFVAVYNYKDDNSPIQRICPAIGAQVNTLEVEPNGNGAVITWSTNLEKNNHGFEIEYAKAKNSDFDINFKKLDFVKSKGKSQSGSFYSYNIDRLSEGEHMFRLRQIDSNGLFEYTDAIAVNIKSDNTPNINTTMESLIGAVPE